MNRTLEQSQRDTHFFMFFPKTIQSKLQYCYNKVYD
jgi:hypothetical protein